jgi:ABC-type sugar transport system substrate-binding protein
MGPVDIGLGNPSPALCLGRTYTIGYDTYSDSDAFPVAVKKDLLAGAQKMGCVTVKVLVDNIDPTTVIQNAQAFVTEKVDGVISFQVLDGPNGAIINMYQQAKIPVVAIALYAVGVTFVSMNDRSAGAQAGAAAAQAFQQQFPGVTPVVFDGAAPQAGLVNLNRTGGIDDAIKAVFPNAKITDIDGKGAEQPANAAMANALGGVPAGAKMIIIGINDEEVAGMYAALQFVNRTADAVAVGIGADTTGINGLCKQGWAADIAAFPEKYGDYALPAIIARINNLPVPPAAYIPTVALTKSNLAQYYPSTAC